MGLGLDWGCVVVGRKEAWGAGTVSYALAYSSEQNSEGKFPPKTTACVLQEMGPVYGIQVPSCILFYYYLFTFSKYF